MNEKNYCIVTTTIDDETLAKEMAASLLEQRLVACVQIHPVESMYHWNGTVEESREYLLQMKTKSRHFGSIKAYLLRQHSYETPEIIMTAIMDANEAYLAWIEKETL